MKTATALTRRALLTTLPAALLGCRVRRPKPSPSSPPYDVCIVGSGFAGVYLGLRLVAHGARTLIIEAGPDRQTNTDPVKAGHRLPIISQGPIPYPIDAFRSISVGGTSRLWTGVLSRLSPADLNVRTLYGLDQDWPLSYADLAPYYCQAEALLAARGRPWQPGAEPVRECPYPKESRKYQSPSSYFQDKTLSFFPLAFSRHPGGGPIRLAEQEIPTFRRSPLASFHSQRRALDLRRTGGRIDHLLVQVPGGQVETLRARFYVVAAGVFESARLLLASRSEESPTGLGDHSGNLGRYFSAHPAHGLHFPSREDLPKGAHRSLSIAHTLRSQALSSAHLQLQISQQETYWSLHRELEPTRANHLQLGDGLDASGQRRAIFHFQSSERDRRSKEIGLALRDDLARALGLAPGSARTSTHFRAHPAGLCRMGIQAADGVVDRHNRVFGLQNLFVSGASVFPTAGTANPTLTVVALTLRLGDHLLGHLGLKTLPLFDR